MSHLNGQTKQTLHSRLASRPILRPPNYDLPFSIAVDASDAAVSAVLFQTVNGIEHLTCFLSRKLKQSELNYSTIEKEVLALITAVRVFSVYYGSQLVTVYTDHRPLEYINRMKSHNAKLSCWSVALGQYALLVQHRPGKDNLLPDLRTLGAFC